MSERSRNDFRRRCRGLCLGFGAALFLAGCGDDANIVFRDREVFNPPPDEASGFLGYYSPAEKLTTCGQCHVGKQAEWETTAHSHALATLTGSGQAQGFCYGCHTVSQNGNPLQAASGWNAIQSTVYHDVQCESCHGPGLGHVENPDSFQPIPSLAVAATLDNGCVECHSGNHHPFAEEWALSKHSQVVETAAGRPECAGCHRGQAILEAWGVNASYLEKDSAAHLPLTCGICHDPHERRHEGQLRFPINTPSVETHLCAKCHNRRANPDPTSTRFSPHAPETGLLEGDAGWFPPDSDIDPGRIIATHGSQANARLCATCHVNRTTVTDAETGEFVFQATGHLFTAIPCVDEQGIPMPGDCDITTAARSFQACSKSGCHGTEQAAWSALTLASTRIRMRAQELLDLLTLADPNLGSPGGPIDGTNTTFTTAEGAFFNYNLATFGGDVTGAATHNPFLTEALLLASITAVRTEYGLPLSSPVDPITELRNLMSRASIP